MAQEPALASERLDDLRRFYSALGVIEERIGGRRKLVDCIGRMNWPNRGVYFFFEPGEGRADSGSGGRVVRVGSHALTEGSSSTLWGRLSQHRGAVSGRGNHRGSIFRLLVGEALLARAERQVPSWGVRGTLRDAALQQGRDLEIIRAEEAPTETAVSRYIGNMPFVWIDISDEPSFGSLRAVIERNSIGLLSNCGEGALDPPSSNWLGFSSSREAVRRSGLWNNNHVRDGYDRSFLRLLT